MRTTRAVLTALLLSAAATAGAQSPADGWAGQVQCVLAARGPGYQDDQTHTWRLSGAPRVQNDFRDYPATWTVSGSGSRKPISARAAAAGGGDSWTHSGSDARASIRLFVPVGTTNLRIASGQVAVKIVQGMRGTGASGVINADVDEWRFQYIDVLNGVAQTTLSGSHTQTRTELVGWRPPPGTTVTETCTWNLAKSGVDQSSNAGAGGRPTGSGTTGSGAAGGASAKSGAAGGGAAAAGGGAASGDAAASGAGASSKIGAGAGGGVAGAGGASGGASSGSGASTKPIGGGSAPAGGTAGGAAAGGAAGSAAASGAAGSAAAGGAGAKGGATGGTSTATSNPDVTRQYAAIGRTPTPGTAVVFATLFDTSGAPLVGVPITDIHLLNGAKQPVGIGPYVFGAVGDIVDNSTLNVTFAFGGSSRVAFLDVPVGTLTLSVSTFVAGSVQTRSVQVTTTAGAAALVQLSSSGSAAGANRGATGSARAGGSTVSKLNPDVQRQYAAIGRTPTPGTGVVFATLVDNAGAPLTGVPLTDIHLIDANSQPVVALGPFVFGAAGDIVDATTLSVTSSFNGRSRVAFLDVPVGRFTLRLSISSGGKVVTRTAQVVTTDGGITLAQP